ncbi:IDEAL domain-containing protein [Lentibacillus saliphilus]|uniref:IDEAL domain-containing protein n=1 Tax=Lentibacillus saliphilus TaxID=2737028 RepID=UPI001C2F8142|nr:IDEAL domain-containing protein [Lentibacillus saliphilus]
MVTVKMLRPYYIKTHNDTLRIVLAYQYFSVFVNHRLYQFVPVEANEIRVNLHTKKIENTEARFAFQKGKDMIYMTMSELISLPDFLVQLHFICEPYYETDHNRERKTDVSEQEMKDIIDELEKMNVQRLIDRALDHRDYQSFKELVRFL